MKITSKLMLVTAALAVVSSARASVANDDILVGFTAGSGNDYLYNVGLVGSLVNGETWTATQGFNAGASFTSFGALGYDNASKTIYSTTGSTTTGPTDTATTFTTIKGNINTINGASTPVAANTSATISSTLTTSWLFQTDQAAGTPGNTLQNNLDNPNVGTGALAYLYSTDNNGDAPVLLGDFSLSPNGSTLTFDTVAVPEPTTYGLIAGVGLLALSLRRQFGVRAS